MFDNFFAEIGRGIEDICFASGYSVILCNSDDDSARELLYLDLLIGKQVDGVLLVPTGNQPRLAATLQTRNIPIVVIDRNIPGAEVDRVHFDITGGGYLATRHLIELGHRSIGYIGGPADRSSVPGRSTGYCHALHEAGLSVDPVLMVEGNFRDAGGYSAAQILLARLAQPDLPVQQRLLPAQLVVRQSTAPRPDEYLAHTKRR